MTPGRAAPADWGRHVPPEAARRPWLPGVGPSVVFACSGLPWAAPGRPGAAPLRGAPFGPAADD